MKPQDLSLRLGSGQAICTVCGLPYCRSLLLVLTEDQRGNPIDRWTGCPHCAKKENEVMSNSEIPENTKEETPGRSVATAKCKQACTDRLCAAAWPDGSCGAYRQGKFYPPLFAAQQQSPAYRAQEVSTVPDADMLDFLDRHNVGSDGDALVWSVFKSHGGEVRLSQSRKAPLRMENQYRGIRVAVIRAVEMAELSSGAFHSADKVLDAMDALIPDEDWVVMVTHRGTRVTLAYRSRQPGDAHRVTIRQAIGAAMREVEDWKQREHPGAVAIQAQAADDQ